MGWFDKFYIGMTPKDIANQMSEDKHIKERDDFSQSIDELLNETSSSVTDRNDIINPEEILEGFDWSTSTEDQALYNRLLQLLRNLQSQQEASYQEWYNSTEQQVLRDRVAGLNTDILGVSGSQASEAGVGQGSPFEGITSQEDLAIQRAQVRNQRFANLISSIGTLANLANVFSGISTLPLQKDLLKAQSDSQNLSNLSNFESLVGSEIGNRLIDSITSAISLGQSLDINEWFGNESNFENVFESYAPSDNPLYRSSFANVRKRMQNNLARAYEQGKVTAENQGSLAAVLSDPTFSANVLLQIAMTQPYMRARKELQLARDTYEKKLAEWNTKYRDALSVRSAVDAANAQSDYDSEYYRNVDAERQAAYDMYIKESQSIRAQMRMAIDKNLMFVYDLHPYDVKGFAASYAFDNAGLAWYEYLGAMEVMNDFRGEVGDSVVESSLSGGFSLSYPDPSRAFIPPGSVGF